MIVAMKKVALFAGLHHADEVLKALRDCGVLHVQIKRGTMGGASVETEQAIERTTSALAKIPRVENPETLVRLPCAVVDEILELSEKREQLLVEKEELEDRIAWYDTWRLPPLRVVSELAAAGVAVRLYTTGRTHYETAIVGLPDVYCVGWLGKTALLAQICEASQAELDLPVERLPTRERRDLCEAHYTVAEQLVQIEGRLSFLGNYARMLEKYLAELSVGLEFDRVKESLDQAKGICVLEGFCPVEALDALRRSAEAHGWAYCFSEPREDDAVPTLIRNPRWVRIIDPVFKFLGTVPGYRELDISLPFLLFFALFVAMLVGDAGYGFIYLALTLLARRKWSKAPAEPFALMYVLSFATIVYGTISGNWFGSEFLANTAVLSALTIPALASFDLMQGGFNDNQMFIIGICFLIGAVHLTLAHAMAAAKKANSPKMVAELGWIGIIWGLYFLTGKLVLERAFPPFAGWLIAVGALLALVFTNYRKNLLKGVGETIIELPIGLIGAFSDVVSYLRLFAVGYASLVLANTFNAMAVGDGISGPLAAIGAAVVLLLGHSLNLVLVAMGVIVHGIRLKMLEFSGHVGNEWAGREYDPFRERNPVVDKALE